MLFPWILPIYHNLHFPTDGHLNFHFLLLYEVCPSVGLLGHTCKRLGRHMLAQSRSVTICQIMQVCTPAGSDEFPGLRFLTNSRYGQTCAFFATVKGATIVYLFLTIKTWCIFSCLLYLISSSVNRPFLSYKTHYWVFFLNDAYVCRLPTAHLTGTMYCKYLLLGWHFCLCLGGGGVVL